MTQIEAPIVGAELDSNDLSGSAMSVVMAILGTAMTFGILAVARSMFNRAAGKSDSVSGIEVL